MAPSRSSINIGVDASWLGFPQGAGRYTRGLLTALPHIDAEIHYTLFTRAASAAEELDVLLFPIASHYIPVFTRAKTVVIAQETPAGRSSAPSHDRRPPFLRSIRSRLSQGQADAFVTASEYARRVLVDRLRVGS